ncbi:MAG: right-handed parallel beta-helix repeat-containing protein [Armatimonadetes bacterium]|nr:right-handed parallel beta-helix repeat-containing protein [Armatimonadota bacterium]
MLHAYPRRSSLIAAVCFSLLGGSTSTFNGWAGAWADSYYVAPRGDDRNQGTEGAPFRSINKAAAVVKEGDVVLVKAGTYSGGIVLTKSGSAEKPIVFKPYGDGEVKIVGQVEQKRGFRLTGGRNSTYEVEETGDVLAVAVDLDATKHVIEGLEAVKSVDEVESGNYRYCHDRQTGKLYVRYTTDNPEKDHTLHVLRDPQAVVITGANVVIEGFTVSRFASNGLTLEGCRNVTIRNCRISLCGHAWGAGIGLHRTEKVQILDCALYRLMNAMVWTEASNTQVNHVTIYRTRAHGIIMKGGANNSVRNSILFAGGPSGSDLYVYQDAATGLKLDYNCYLDYMTSVLISWRPLDGSYPTFWDYRRAIKSQDNHSLSDDPLFRSIEQGSEDFRLKPNSPCRKKAGDGEDMGVTSG